MSRGAPHVRLERLFLVGNNLPPPTPSPMLITPRSGPMPLAVTPGSGAPATLPSARVRWPAPCSCGVVGFGGWWLGFCGCCCGFWPHMLGVRRAHVQAGDGFLDASPAVPEARADLAQGSAPLSALGRGQRITIATVISISPGLLHVVQVDHTCAIGLGALSPASGVDSVPWNCCDQQLRSVCKVQLQLRPATLW